ncbi:MAG: amidohydrolase family protein [Saprospiraceae bacterium]|nr:amidohydrolase family protein [Saprospiraceae bacterium]
MSYHRRKFIRDISSSVLGMGLVNPVMSFPYETFSMEEHQETAPVLYFDAFTEIGPRRVSHSRQQTSLLELLAEMNQCSISGALVASTMSVSYDAHFSNLRLSEWLKPYSNLYAIWNILPSITGEFPDVQKLGKLIQEHGIKAVAIHPTSNAWDWQGDYCRELFEWLSDRQMLTIIPSFTELGGWREVDVFLNKYPRLPVFLRNISWAAQRYLIPLIKQHANLHICFDTFQINEGPEYFYQEGLTDQVLFASNAPTMSAGAHRTMIDYAQVPRDARAKMAGGNIIRLLRDIPPPVLSENKSSDSLMHAASMGMPQPVDVIDMHMHILHEGLQGAGRHYRMQNGGPSGVFSLVEKLGYSGGGFMSWDGVVSQDAASGNETTRLALDAAPPGYWGLGTFDPTQFSQEEMSEMIHKVYSDQRFIGMKPYPLYGVEFHDPSYDIWWEYGQKNNLYGLLHNARSDLKETDVLAGKYPNVRWVIAHAANSFPMAEKAIELMQKHSNVYAEITYTTVPLGAIEYLVEEAGADRVLYGSDLPMRDPRPQLGWVIYTRLTQAVKENILATNALEVLKPCMSRLPERNRPVLK